MKRIHKTNKWRWLTATLLGLIVVALSAAGVTAQQIITQTDIDAGRAAYEANGCGACHGANAAGGSAGPLGAYPAELVRRQVRAPFGDQPPVLPEAMTNKQLEQLIIYLSTLPPAPLPTDLNLAHDEILWRYWIAFFSVLRNDNDDVRFQLEQIGTVVVDGHQERIQQLLAALNAGDKLTVIDGLQDSLAGVIVPDSTPAEMYLEAARLALAQQKAEAAVHDLQQFINIGPVEQTAAAQAALQSAQAGDAAGALAAVEGLLGV